MRLAITGGLAKTLCSTNPCESMIEIVRRTQRNVKRWQDGDTRKRWTAAGMLVAEQQFRRIIGYRDLAKLVAAIERHTARAAPSNPRHRRSRRDTTNRYCLTVKSRRPLPKFHHDPDILRHVAGSCSRPQCEPFLLNQQDHAQPAMRGQRSVSVLHSGPSLRS